MSRHTLLQADTELETPNEVSDTRVRHTATRKMAYPFVICLIAGAWWWFLGPTVNLGKFRLVPGLAPLFGSFAQKAVPYATLPLETQVKLLAQEKVETTSPMHCEAVQTCVETEVHTGTCWFFTVAPLYVLPFKGAQKCGGGKIAAGSAVISTKFEVPVLIFAEGNDSPNDCCEIFIARLTDAALSGQRHTWQGATSRDKYFHLKTVDTHWWKWLLPLGRWLTGELACQGEGPFATQMQRRLSTASSAASQGSRVSCVCYGRFNLCVAGSQQPSSHQHGKRDSLHEPLGVRAESLSMVQETHGVHHDCDWRVHHLLHECNHKG